MRRRLMTGENRGGCGSRAGAVGALALFLCMAAQGAFAGECPGHPDAIGTSRTLVIDPRQHPRIGTMQYAETLPLNDHEVVLTFDDGPLPAHSNQVLDILAAQCVKATFFEIGRMAQAFPEGVRKLRDAGHTIGTHSQNHPLSMNHMPIDRARQEIDNGIASIKKALGDDESAVAPFFRIPGLLRAEGVEDYLAGKGIQVWSADFPADDWRPVSSSRVYELAMQRLQAKGKGILLLHDIQARTVVALPKILRELKARGFHIVHVVPATPDRPATPTEPRQWLMHSPEENVAARWPAIPHFVFTSSEMLPAPEPADFSWSGTAAEPSGRGTRSTSWPRPQVSPVDATSLLPIPARHLFEPGISSPPGGAGQRLANASAETMGMTTVDAGRSLRIIPGSAPLTVPGLRRGPIGAH